MVAGVCAQLSGEPQAALPPSLHVSKTNLRQVVNKQIVANRVVGAFVSSQSQSADLGPPMPTPGRALPQPAIPMTSQQSVRQSLMQEPITRSEALQATPVTGTGAGTRNDVSPRPTVTAKRGRDLGPPNLPSGWDISPAQSQLDQSTGAGPRHSITDLSPARVQMPNQSKGREVGGSVSPRRFSSVTRVPSASSVRPSIALGRQSVNERQVANAYISPAVVRQPSVPSSAVRQSVQYGTLQAMHHLSSAPRHGPSVIGVSVGHPVSPRHMLSTGAVASGAVLGHDGREQSKSPLLRDRSPTPVARAVPTRADPRLSTPPQLRPR